MKAMPTLPFALFYCVLSGLNMGSAPGEAIMIQEIVLRPSMSKNWKNGTISKSQRLLFTFATPSKNDVVRVEIGSDLASPGFPLLTVIQEEQSVLSWSLPLELEENITVQSVARTLCPANHEMKSSNITVELMTSSKDPIDYHLSVYFVPHQQFHLSFNRTSEMTASLTEPQYVRYTFRDSEKDVLVKVTSEDDTCMVVSIQDTSCPVYDLPTNVFADGIRQSMTRLSAVQVKRSKFGKDFYVVFVVPPYARNSCWIEFFQPNYTVQDGVKKFSVTVQPTISWVVAFNNIFSNLAYVMLGLLFLIQVNVRDRAYRETIGELSMDGTVIKGLPGYFGLFYAIGAALMIEGVMSASYHVCPNYSNFQFDTAFMYILSALGILKIYQKRHPDINAGSHVTFTVLALVVLLSVIGVSFNGLAFWIIFATCYFLLLINLTAELYYKGKRHVGFNCCREIKDEITVAPKMKMGKPKHMDRVAFLVLGNILNLTFIVLGLVTRTRRFGTYMLAIFITNLILYTTFYLVMKVRYQERLRWRPIVYIILSTASWIPALWFFFNVKYDTNVPAAVSRSKNEPCVLLDFYDVHDIWHFLSALGLFFSFKILLSMDDDIKRVPQSCIHAF